MEFVRIDGRVLHMAHRSAAPGRPTVAFANSLGTDLRIWDAVVAGLPADIGLLRWDKRGHGLSDDGAGGIADHAADLAALLDRAGVTGAVICGVSVGGMIAQALASIRPDLCGGLALMCTGAKIGDEAGWQARIDAVRAGGIAPMADAVLERWFSPAYAETSPEGLAGARNMLVRTDAEGYAAVCAAIRDADLRASTAALRLPVRCLAGADDQATPPELVRALAALIPGATVEVLPDVGHLPPLEAPGAVLRTLRGLLAGL